jgi:trans-aconitate 2-methyltransferase
MTEWNASEYARLSALQAAMAEEVLMLLDLKGTERILDIGCGNGKVTAEIAERVPGGTVAGVDASAGMIAFAAAQCDPRLHPNLQFAVADARHLLYQHEFDLVVSFQRASLDSRTGPGAPIHTLSRKAGRLGTAAAGTER